VHVYNNTFIDSPATFQRDERSAVADHFGWHSSTGPDVDQREGHVFLNNLLVASESFAEPLLRFEQPASLCESLTRPMANEVNGNVYVRATTMGAAEPSPLVVWSPAATENCTVTLGSLEEFRSQVPANEVDGLQIDRSPQSVFKGPDVGRYELLQMLPGERGTVPADIRKHLGWSEADARTIGAFPLRP
jgi:hypothetical protein